MQALVYILSTKIYQLLCIDKTALCGVRTPKKAFEGKSGRLTRYFENVKHTNIRRINNKPNNIHICKAVGSVKIFCGNINLTQACSTKRKKCIFVTIQQRNFLDFLALFVKMYFVFFCMYFLCFFSYFFT